MINFRLLIMLVRDPLSMQRSGTCYYEPGLITPVFSDRAEAVRLAEELEAGGDHRVFIEEFVVHEVVPDVFV